MKRLCRFFPAVICLLFLAAVPFVGAQNATEVRSEFQANPGSNDVVGARLIAWSEFQNPKPLVEGTQPAAAKSDQHAGQAAKAISTPQDRRPAVAPQFPNSHSSSIDKVEPGGR